MPSSIASLSYHEPDIVTILILASFLVLLNAINYIFDVLVYCGLIGQIAIGIAWGAPGANWLSESVQATVVQLGYLGLILLVYEGGLQTNIKTLRSNLFLSSVVALIGITAPIGLSFTLQGFVYSIAPIKSFAAGAALCSTSLGTIFTLLSTSGLSQSRLGVVLSSAAMLDDIVGLVMSGIISSLGQSSDFSAITVIRPVFVSLAFGTILPLVCVVAIGPLLRLSSCRLRKQHSRIWELLSTESAAFVFHLLTLSAFISGSSYAGTSNLFASYLAGATLTWFDGNLASLKQVHPQNETNERSPGLTAMSQPRTSQNSSDTLHGNDRNVTNNNVRVTMGTENSSPSSIQASTQTEQTRRHGGITAAFMFGKYIEPTLRAVLKPFFFASIGFSIPISRMFTGSILWRGFVYSILMILAKLLCGLCLIRFDTPTTSLPRLRRLIPSSIPSCLPWPVRTTKSKSKPIVAQTSRKSNESRGETSENSTNPSQISTPSPTAKPPTSKISRPKSLYPAALLGSAMVARGEIGFLISAVAEGNNIYGTPDDGGSSELFLIVTWAILLCTILGPLTVGIMVRRVKRLQKLERGRQSGKEDPLGIWGIVA